MSRFSLDLTEVSDERVLIPTGFYEARVAKGEVMSGVSDNGPWARLNLTLVIKDPEVAKLLCRDEPKVFFNAPLFFDKETGAFNSKGCPEAGQFIKVTGFDDITLFEEGAEDADSEFDYIVKVFSNMAEASVGTELMAKVVKKPYHKDKEILVNEVSKISRID